MIMKTRAWFFDKAVYFPVISLSFLFVNYKSTSLNLENFYNLIYGKEAALIANDIAGMLFITCAGY
jgi:hypothetical protein